MLALLRLLDLGASWDAQLVAATGRSAREVTQFGVLGLFITGRMLDATLLRSFSTFSVLSFFGVDGTEERPLAGDLPITISQPGAGRIQPLTLLTSACGVRTSGARPLMALEMCSSVDQGCADESRGRLFPFVGWV